MKLFAIDADNNITALAAGEEVPENQQKFSTEKELAKLAAQWPGDRPAQIWNSFAGVAPFGELKPVRKFTDRKTGVARIWKAIQRLEAHAAPPAPKTAPTGKRSRKRPSAEGEAPTAREGSKKAIVLEMLRRPEGATLKSLMAATSWQPHSVRGFISGALGKKMSLKVESFKGPDGERAYRLPQ